MAEPTELNGQITDAVTQTNVHSLGVAPAVGMGNLYQAMAQSLALAAHNATHAQQHLNILAHAVTAASVALIHGGSTVGSLQGLVDKIENEPPPAPEQKGKK